MVTLARSAIIDAPADTVWEVVADQFDRIGDWATAIADSAACPAGNPVADAPVPGRVCHTGIALVPEVTETIVAFDQPARTLVYEATAGMPAFVTRARNRWQVAAAGDARAQVSLAADLQVRGLLGWLARWWLLVQVGRTGRHLLDDLRHYCEHGTASPRKQRQLDRAAAENHMRGLAGPP
jgi:Polyketide cyclase / dehydrase and lipid transport